jgi:UDP-N-acetylglucosamine 4,6-dehydratase
VKKSIIFSRAKLVIDMNEYKNKTLLITGGTGSFGNAVLKGMLKVGLKEIRIFSRDEKKQDDMRKQLNDSTVNFYSVM